MANCHVQTIWAPLLRRTPLPPVLRRTLPTPDGDRLSVYWLEGRRKDAPLVVLLHGLEGSITTHTMRGALAEIYRRGWHGLAMEYRGCGPYRNKLPVLYHSGQTEDVDCVMRLAAESAAPERIAAVGFSLGGNLLGKWLGEQGASAPIAAGAVLSTPFDLAAAARAIDSALNGFYAKRLLRSLIPKAIAKERQFPGLFATRGLRELTSIAEYDERVTAPLHGFRGAAEYYQRCSSGRFLSRVRKPLLALSALDDPMAPADGIPRNTLIQSPWLHPLLTRRGGHLGFVTRERGKMVYWWEKAVFGFLEEQLVKVNS